MPTLREDQGSVGKESKIARKTARISTSHEDCKLDSALVLVTGFEAIERRHPAMRAA
jgi:hypothetical protein